MYSRRWFSFSMHPVLLLEHFVPICITNANKMSVYKAITLRIDYNSAKSIGFVKPGINHLIHIRPFLEFSIFFHRVLSTIQVSHSGRCFLIKFLHLRYINKSQLELYVFEARRSMFVTGTFDIELCPCVYTTIKTVTSSKSTKLKTSPFTEIYVK